jgi:tryptophan halogenase
MDHWPERKDPVYDEIPRERALAALDQRRTAIEASAERMPPHHRTLLKMLG